MNDNGDLTYNLQPDPGKSIGGGEIILRRIVDRMNLMQSNTITLSRVSLTKLQDNILTSIIDQLQDVLNGVRDLDIDNFDLPYVTIDCGEIAAANNKYKVKQALEKLTELKFKMNYYNRITEKKQETSGVIICTWTDIENTNRLFVGINPWAIPALIYCGKNVGGTIFSKNVSYQLESIYSKRIYKFICSQRNSEEPFFDFDINYFREYIGIPASYGITNIRKKILEVAKKQINKSDSDMTFDFEEILESVTPGKKRTVSKIRLITKSKDAEDIPKENIQETKEWKGVYHYIRLANKSHSDSAVAQATEALNKAGKLTEAYERFVWIDNKVSAGEMASNGQRWTTSLMQGSIRKYVKETLQAYAKGTDIESINKIQNIVSLIADNIRPRKK